MLAAIFDFTFSSNSSFERPSTSRVCMKDDVSMLTLIWEAISIIALDTALFLQSGSDRGAIPIPRYLPSATGLLDTH